MSGRLTYMKYTAIVAVAVFSLILAIPLSKQSVKQQKDLSFKPVSVKVVAQKVAVKAQALPTVTHATVNVAVAQPTPAPVVYTASYRCEAYQSDFEQYNWNVDVAMAICQAESSGNPYAVSPTCDRGLMEINCIHSDMVNGNLSALFNPATNIAVAYRLYYTNGWSPWTTFNDGAYLQYLN